MLVNSKNRVQAIKSKFENLNSENEPVSRRKPCEQLSKHTDETSDKNGATNKNNKDLEGIKVEIDDSNKPQNSPPKPNNSYLHGKKDSSNIGESTKKLLTRQSSDPCKKLQRSHAFRGDKTKVVLLSPKRPGSLKVRTSDVSPETSGKKLSKDRLKELGNILDSHMSKENFVATQNAKSFQLNCDEDLKNECDEPNNDEVENNQPVSYNSIPDEQVPKHILEQYAKVLKPKKRSETPEKQEFMTDSGVSSETENVDEEKVKIKKIVAQFEGEPSKEHIKKIRSNLDLMDSELCGSTDTVRLERKNPNLVLTDTLKKALKQPLPAGPPPKKPPRTFTDPIPENPEKKDTKKMLEKLEQALQKREQQTVQKNIYDVAETNLSQPNSQPKEIHYLCTEILDITQRTLLPNQTSNGVKNCFNSLNCAVTAKSTLSLPYTRISTGSIADKQCTCSSENLEKRRLSTFFKEENVCSKCQKEPTFKCHLNCECSEHLSAQTSDQNQVKDHIYDVPFVGDVKCNTSSVNCNIGSVRKCKSEYGVVNQLTRIYSRSLEDIKNKLEEEKIYDIPCEDSRPATPEDVSMTEFQKLKRNFESMKPEHHTIPKPHLRCDKLVSRCDKLNSRCDKLDSRCDKPLLKPKPVLVKIPSDPKIDLSKEVRKSFKNERSRSIELQCVESKFSLERRQNESRRSDRESQGCLGNIGLGKKEKQEQLDIDRENLNRLMNEIYETVSAACEMDDATPGRFPTHSCDSSSEDSVKLTRSLTEKRKNYVRRVSSRAAYLEKTAKKRYRNQTSVCSYKSETFDNPYPTFRSWKSFKNSQTNLQDSKMAALDICNMAAVKSNMADLTDSKFNLTDSSGNLLTMKDDFESLDNMVDKAGCLDLDLPFEPKERGLFDVCLLVDFNYMSGQAYVKSIFPSQVKVPPHIENLIFPETISSEENKLDYESSPTKTQSYSFVLTDEKGERRYGYCRRVLPEGATCCLPLCYCIIGRFRAPGFYYKVLREIEANHGSSEVETNTILQQLFDSDFPNPGQEINIAYEYTLHQELTKNKYRKSVNLGDILKSKTLPGRKSNENREFFSGNDKKSDFSSNNFEKSELSSRNVEKSELSSKNVEKGEISSENFENMLLKNLSNNDLPEFYDVENNNRPKSVFLSVQSEKVRVIKMPIEPRVDETNLSVLLDTMGASLLIKLFGSMLLERKVVLVGDNLSQLSSCIEGLQSILYPFVWQQPLISSIPSELTREILEAPVPILAGLLMKKGTNCYEDISYEEGILVDITECTPKVEFYQGDESTILPTNSYKNLKTTLQMETHKNQNRSDDNKTRNVLISEAFLRFFVDILDGFCEYFSMGARDSGFNYDGVNFDKDGFIKSAKSKQTQYFLEWFTETTIFNHFLHNMAASYKHRTQGAPLESPIQGIVDAPLPNFYELFENRTSTKEKNVQKLTENGKTNYKTAMNKKVKLLKNKLRDLIT